MNSIFKTSLLVYVFIFFAGIGSSSAEPPELLAGAASYDITPPVGTPLGGSGGFPRRYKYLVDWFGRHPYANFFTPSQGVHDPLFSKVLILKNHKSSILFISLDLIGVTSELQQKLSSDLKKSGEFDEVIISATHTHSGSGALSTSWMWELLAMDRFNQVVYDDFIGGVRRSIEIARERLEPAILEAGMVEVEEIHRNRRKRPGHMDNRANLLIAKTTDGQRTIGGIVNYAIHGMAMGGNGFLFSADVSGGIERHLEKLFSNSNNSRKPTMLFVNGSEGDVTTVYGGSEGVEKAGQIMASKASLIKDSMRRIHPDWNVSRMTVKMPKARVNTAACGAMIGKKPLNINFFIDSKAATRDALIWQIDIGDIRIMSFPGEPTTDIGDAARALSKSKDGKDAWIFGLTNGHMGYFVTHDEYKKGGIEGCTALHGPNAASVLLKAHEEILNTKKDLIAVE